jgi:hypothetical protein
MTDKKSLKIKKMTPEAIQRRRTEKQSFKIQKEESGAYTEGQTRRV